MFSEPQVEYLARCAAALRDSPTDADKYALIGQLLAGAYPDLILAVSIYDPEADMFRLRALHGVDSMRAAIRKLLGKDPIDIDGDFGPATRRALGNGRFQKIEAGLSDFSDKVLHGTVAKAVERMLGITGFHVIGLVHEEQPLGAVTFVLRTLQQLPDPQLIEAFARQAVEVLALDGSRVAAMGTQGKSEAQVAALE